VFLIYSLVFWCYRFGRRVTFFVFSVWQYVTTFLLSFVQESTLYGILMFLCGISGLVNYIAAMLLGKKFLVRLLAFYYETCSLHHNYGFIQRKRI